MKRKELISFIKKSAIILVAAIILMQVFLVAREKMKIGVLEGQFQNLFEIVEMFCDEDDVMNYIDCIAFFNALDRRHNVFAALYNDRALLSVNIRPITSRTGDIYLDKQIFFDINDYPRLIESLKNHSTGTEYYPLLIRTFTGEEKVAQQLIHYRPIITDRGMVLAVVSMGMLTETIALQDSQYVVLMTFFLVGLAGVTGLVFSIQKKMEEEEEENKA